MTKATKGKTQTFSSPAKAIAQAKKQGEKSITFQLQKPAPAKKK
jgi:hypothetical protein